MMDKFIVWAGALLLYTAGYWHASMPTPLFFLSVAGCSAVIGWGLGGLRGAQ